MSSREPDWKFKLSLNMRGSTEKGTREAKNKSKSPSKWKVTSLEAGSVGSCFEE